VSRNAILVAVAVAVFAAGIYLFAQIRGREEPSPEVDTAAKPPAAEPSGPTRPPPNPTIPRPERRPPIRTRPAEAVKPADTSIAGAEDTSIAGAEAAVLVRKASNAYAGERYSAALEYAAVALESDESSVLARSLAVLSACAIGRKDVAGTHAAKLDQRRRQPLLARCRDEYSLEIEIP
jgi:hypothetical protein